MTRPRPLSEGVRQRSLPAGGFGRAEMNRARILLTSGLLIIALSGGCGRSAPPVAEAPSERGSSDTGKRGELPSQKEPDKRAQPNRSADAPPAAQKKGPASLRDDYAALQGSWDCPPANAGGVGIELHFVKDRVEIRKYREQATGRETDLFPLLKFELKEIEGKRAIVLRFKQQELGAVVYQLNGDRLRLDDTVFKVSNDLPALRDEW